MKGPSIIVKWKTLIINRENSTMNLKARGSPACCGDQAGLERWVSREGRMSGGLGKGRGGRTWLMFSE